MKDLLNLLALLLFKHSPKALMAHSVWGGYACGKKCKFFYFFSCYISIVRSFYVDKILKRASKVTELTCLHPILPLLTYQYYLILSSLHVYIADISDKLHSLHRLEEILEENSLSVSSNTRWYVMQLSLFVEKKRMRFELC